jgi:dolichol-phosphate mannosyltransferase
VQKANSIAVVIPCFRVKAHVLSVINSIGPEVEWIIAVDDLCPENSGKYIDQESRDPRVRVFYQSKNSGVGGATTRGFSEAYKMGAQIIVKLDGDGQMDPRLIPALVEPIQSGYADYTKGNRFFTTQVMASMPWVRLMGNAGVSFLAKITSGYWQLMDPTNGFLAIHASLLPFIELQKLQTRFFFENDLLFRLGLIRAVVLEITMDARYGDEKSSLSVSHSLFSFPGKFLSRFFKRIIYRYFVRDFNIGSCLLVGGFVLTMFGLIFGGYHWWHSISHGIVASSGTVMLAGLPFLLGMQMLFFSFLFDVLSTPKEVLHPHLNALLRAGLKKDF